MNSFKEKFPSAFFGIATGLIASLFIVIAHFTGLTRTDFATKMGIVVPILQAIATWISLKYYKMKVYDGMINYSQALFAGIKTATFTAIVFALYSVCYVQFIDPEFVNFWSPIMQKNMEASTNPKMTPAQIKEELEYFRKLYQPGTQLIAQFFNCMLTGTFFSAILAIFVRNSDTFFMKEKTA